MQSGLSKLRNVIVTGSNKGIGYSIVEGLIGGQAPYHVVLTTRTVENGQKAAEEIKKKHPNSSSQLTVKQLDINDTGSADAFVEWVKNDLKTVDVLINNAAVNNYNSNSVETKLEALNINFFKTVELTEKLQPYLAADGKIIMISSGAGKLFHQSEKAQKMLDDSSLDREKLMKIANDLVKGIKEGREDTDLIVNMECYNSSKALLNSYIRFVLVRQVKEGQQVYAVCPGWCKTDMGSQQASRTSERGAETPIYLTNLPFEVNSEIQGKFLKDKAVMNWSD